MDHIPEFQTFGEQHLIALAAIAVLGLLIAGSAKQAAISRRKWLGRLLGFLLLSYSIVIYVRQGIQQELSWEYSLPLDVCSLVLTACIVTLFWPSQFASEIAYFWGLGGVLQATLTPDIIQGFPSWEFILYFWGHGVTLLAIIFLIADRKFKPRRGSILRMMLFLNLYVLVVGTIDALMHLNYGFLCQKPQQPSLLDYLGPWPWYLVWSEFVAFLSFFLLDLPWRILLRRQKQDRNIT